MAIALLLYMLAISLPFVIDGAVDMATTFRGE